MDDCHRGPRAPITALMGDTLVEDDPQVEALLREAAPRAVRPLPARERASEAFMGLLLLAACWALLALAPRGPELELSRVLVLGAAFVAAHRVRFSIGGGMMAPSQLVLIPMLLLLPAAVVPALVAVSLLVARLPEYLTGRAHPDRVLLHFADAVYALGPAAVIAFADPGSPDIRHWPVYAAAVAAQFVADAGASTLREKLASGVAPALQLRLLWPVFGFDAALTPVGLLIAGAAAPQPYTVLMAAPLLGLLALMGRERERRIQQALALSDAYRGSALLMGEMLEADDEYTGGEHSQGVVALALAVGQEMGLDARAQRNLEFGALLHDIGKLRVPNEIINKPGKLDSREWEIVRRHPTDGQEMLDRIGGALSEVGVIVRGHHERWDGGGYPDGTVGFAIPLAARIICACDAYSAMTTDRSYRAALPHDTAMAELRDCAGTQFDPEVVEAIEAVMRRERPAQPSVVLTRSAG
jgi:putative nucleotidyltransferase with HDIG domain